MVLSVNLWSEQEKKKVQLSFIMLPKIQNPSEWSLRRKLEQEQSSGSAVFFCLGQNVQNDHMTKAEKYLLYLITTVLIKLFHWSA